jgi:molecular chaperone GrpE (heat shock protein)
MAGPTPEELRRQQDMTDSVETMEDTYRSIAVLLKDMLVKQKEIEGSTKKVAEEYSKDLTKTYRQLAKDSLTVVDNGERLLTGSIKSKEIQKQITDLTSRQSFINSRINQLKKQGVEFDNEDLRIQQDSNETIDEQLKLLQAQLVVSKNIEKTAGLTAKIFEGIKEIP